jgi:hypothetical protein
VAWVVVVLTFSFGRMAPAPVPSWTSAAGMEGGWAEDASILQIFFLRVGPTPVLRSGWIFGFEYAYKFRMEMEIVLDDPCAQFDGFLVGARHDNLDV